MKKRFVYLVAALALVASFSFATTSPNLASADEHQDRCNELFRGA